MARILIVHGISNQFAGEMELRGPWYLALCDGLLRAGVAVADLPPETDCFCPFYGDLFRPADRLGSERTTVHDLAELTVDESQLLEAVWREAASIDPAVPGPEEFDSTLAFAPRIAERALTALARSEFLANTIPLRFLGDLKQVVAYLDDRSIRAGA